VAEHVGIGREGCKNVFVELFHVDEDGSADWMVALREDMSCSWVNMGRRLCGLT